MILSLRSLSQTVSDAAAAAQAACLSVLDFTVGEPLLAIFQAAGGMVLWLQYVALQVLSVTRLATSQGADVDSFVADYALTRLPARAATGLVTFSRYTNTTQGIIAAGATVKTGDGTQTFTVTIDTTNTLWSATASAYLVPSGTTSVTVPVQAAVAGSAGNVLAGTISLLASSMPGIDTVTNAVAITTGADAETDAALKARFPLYLSSLSQATAAAVQYAALSVETGLSCVIVNGLGYFALTIDDGTGAPSSALIASVYAAVAQVIPLGCTFGVFGPTVTNVSVSITLTVPAGSLKPIAAVNAAVAAYVSHMPVAQILPYGRLMQIVFDASPLVTNALILVNGATADINPGATGVVMVTSLAVQ